MALITALWETARGPGGSVIVSSVYKFIAWTAPAKPLFFM